MNEAPTLVVDFEAIRAQFPILNQEINGQPLVYFDNAATSQKPQIVIDTISDYYKANNANVHRGVHYLSQIATDKIEESREKVRAFVNAEKGYEVIFTKGTTDGINMIANSLSKGIIKKGDEVIISHLEHHSNIVPWQMLCETTGAVLKVIPMNERGELVLEEYEKLLSEKTKIVAFNHVSNALGTINPAKEMIAMAHEFSAWVLVDGAQAVPHQKVDVQELDADFYVFSGHKMCGPTGIGILYGKEEIIEKLPPSQGGGEMIETVSFEKTTYAGLPFKFEAGTPNISGAIGLGAAVDFLNEIGMENIAEREQELLQYGTQRLSEFNDLKIYGDSDKKASVISFLLGNIHPYDAGSILDKLGIALRTGHHCTQPIMDFYKILGTLRASLAFYNTQNEIDRLCEGLRKVKQMLA